MSTNINMSTTQRIISFGVLIFCAVAIVLGIVSISTQSAQAYTSPGAPIGFVNDFAQILTADQKLGLEQSLTDFELQTTHEIAVVTIPTLAGDTIEQYANELFADWKIGKEGIDNGVLFLVALQDRRVRIEVGYGLEGALTDAESKYIIDQIIIPSFRNNQYAEGVLAGTEAIKQAVVDEVAISGIKTSRGMPAFLEKIINLVLSAGDISIVFFIILIQILISVLAKSKAWWHGGVLGGIVGMIVFYFAGLSIGIISILILVIFGLAIDYHISKSYKAFKAGGPRPWFMSHGRGGGFGGRGGFGGFGGGSSGGGGASGGW